ncbi:MAG: SpoIIE family protein phosphatase [bacterium]|nr:SpoIIE family protein phosphatase [bacterium]
MPPERQNSNPLSGFYGLLLSRGAHLSVGIAVVIAVLFCGFDATRTRPSDGTVWSLAGQDLEVLDVLPSGGAAPTPLRRGDIIVGINHRIMPSPQKAAEELRRHEPGQAVDYLVRRDGRQVTMPVPLRSTRVDLEDYTVNVLLASVYLIIGFAVFLRSGNDRPASLFFMLCLAFGLYFMTNLQQTNYFLGALITQNIGAFARFVLPAIFLHFFLVFPTKKLRLTRHPFLAPLIYLLPVMFYIRFTLDQVIGREGAKIDAVTWILLGVYYVLGLVALLHSYFNYRDPLMRQRVRILTFGTLAAVVPFLIFKIGLEELTYRSGLTRLGAVPLVMIPISFGYCVARYRVLQIDLLLKRNLAHGLLSGAIWIVYLGGAWWLGGRVLTLLPDASPLSAAGVTLAVTAVLWPARARLQRSLDLGFYRSRDNMAGLLEEFSKEIPRLLQREALLQRVGGRLVEVLGLPGMAVYLVDGNDDDGVFVLAGAVSGGYAAMTGTEPPAETGDHYPRRLGLPSIAAVLEERGEPFWADAGEALELDERPAITREQAELKARALEQFRLGDIGIQLLVPMITQNRLVGIVALPPRPDEADYEAHELQLLNIVAGQVALQVENSRLYEEEVAKQKLEEEMVMARQIQSRLLPRVIPVFEGVEIQAVNISSKQVSGDYYDMIERDDGVLGIVIADVSGKGMPASILASNIQAALRAQCDNCESPAVVLERINRQIHASTDPQHFATLFLALFDPATRRLRYSSGGHNAPIIIRADSTVELLEEGGLPLGAFDFGSYDEGNVQLEPGDLLFLYTDGLTETKGLDGDEDFGEDRLNDLLREARTDGVTSIFENIGDRLRDFSGRTDADDDITMIGLKIQGADEAAVANAGGRR